MRFPRIILLFVSFCALSFALSGCSSVSLMSVNSSGAGGATPTVVAVGDQVNGVAPNRWQYVQFSEAMDPASINSQTFVVTDSNGRAVAGNVFYDASFNVAGFQPNPALQNNASYTATLTTGIASSRGVHMSKAYSYNFTTRADTDMSPPWVSSVTPVPNATCVSFTTPITIIFSEGLDLSTLTSTNIVITGPGNTVIQAQISYNVGTPVVTLTPNSPLPSGSITVTVHNVADAAGVVMTSVYGWSFQTTCSHPTGEYSVVYTFKGSPNDGAYPAVGLIQYSSGNLYGITSGGGSSGNGTIFKVDSSGHETVLYSFAGGSGDGANPVGNLVTDSSGNLYGVTQSGGPANAGTVYKVDPSGNETLLHSFNFTGKDGSIPVAGLVIDSAGNLYGTTDGGGPQNFGTVFKIDPSGKETVLHNFTAADGQHPEAGLLLDSAGNLYGTTRDGGLGAGTSGTVFKVDPSGNESVLYSFTGGNDGGNPEGSVVMDSAGNLYGTTEVGGTNGDGTVFKLDPSGKESVLHSFTGPDGAGPYGTNLAMDAMGNLYGTTERGGAYSWGAVFQLDRFGNEFVLHSFTNRNGDGAGGGALVLDPSGILYGGAGGGSLGDGIVFKIALP
jgi:uncharacterized repeat protein (TIGR03803 family)